MKYSIYFLLLTGILGPAFMNAEQKTYDPQKTTVAVDESLLNKRAGIIKNAVLVVGGILSSEAKSGKLGQMLKALPRGVIVGFKKAKSETGSSNIIHATLGQLKDEGKGDFSHLEPQLLQLSVQRTPREDMIQAVDYIKKQGYETIRVSNMNIEQQKIFDQKMKYKYDIDFAPMFDGSIVYAAYNDKDNSIEETEHYYVLRDGTYAAKHPKDSPIFYQPLKEQCIADSKDCVFISENAKYLAAANKPFQQFKLYTCSRIRDQ